MSVEAPVKKFALKDYKSDLHNDWCPGCLTPDTLIVMADGSRKRIAEVVVGDSVIAHDGKPHGVIEVMSHMHPAPLRRIAVSGTGSVSLTNDHPVYLARFY